MENTTCNNMVNTKHDTHTYECTCKSGESGYQREIYDGNILYEAYIKAKNSSSWKPQTQHFEMNYLTELAKLSNEIKDRTYELSPTTHFILNERGKTRPITCEQIQDRVVKHALCDSFLNPAIQKYLIYDNAASQKGKGISFTRNRLVKHLHHYYMTHGSNNGYILLMDYSKYYDNIRHQTLLDLFSKYINNDNVLWLLRKIIKRSEIDVSYMADDEYENCMNILFNSLIHNNIDRSLLTGEKMMKKHLNIGDQLAQTAGIFYPMQVDNYITIVKGISGYARYMDDSYAIHESKSYLQEIMEESIDMAWQELGITINRKKTRICKLSECWRFLQIQYSLTDTGRVIQKINPKRLTAMRHKMKKVAYILDEKEFEDWYWSWFKNYYKIMSRQQRENMDMLFAQTKEIAKCNKKE